MTPLKELFEQLFGPQCVIGDIILQKEIVIFSYKELTPSQLTVFHNINKYYLVLVGHSLIGNDLRSSTVAP